MATLIMHITSIAKVAYFVPAPEFKPKFGVGFSVTDVECQEHNTPADVDRLSRIYVSYLQQKN